MAESKTVKLDEGDIITIVPSGKNDGIYNARIESKKGISRDSSLSLDKDSLLVVEGKGHGTIVLPKRMETAARPGQARAAFAPRIQLNTDQPVRIEGGSYLLAKDSDQLAVTEITPVALTHMTGLEKNSGDVIATTKMQNRTIGTPDNNVIANPAAQEKGHLALFPAGARYMALGHPNQGNLRYVGVEGGKARNDFINPRNKNAPLFTLSAEESLEVNNKRFDHLRARTTKEAYDVLDVDKNKYKNKAEFDAAKAQLGIPVSQLRGQVKIGNTAKDIDDKYEATLPLPKGALLTAFPPKSESPKNGPASKATLDLVQATAYDLAKIPKDYPVFINGNNGKGGHPVLKKHIEKARDVANAIVKGGKLTPEIIEELHKELEDGVTVAGKIANGKVPPGQKTIAGKVQKRLEDIQKELRDNPELQDKKTRDAHDAADNVRKKVPPLSWKEADGVDGAIAPRGPGGHSRA